jgi:hypothetical protein
LLQQRAADGKWRDEPYEAQCIWRGRDVDLALLKIGDGEPLPAYTTVFASLERETAGLEAVGYPYATWDAEQNAREYRVSGSLRSESEMYPLAFAVPMADVPKDISKWKGMSGAVVIGRDSSDRVRVFGAIQQVSDVFPNGKLYVARIAAAFEEPAFQQALKRALGEEPTLVHEPQPAAVFRFPNVDSQERIYATFRSAHQTLHGRSRELDHLTQLLFPGTPIKVVAVQAIGGMGKTALARECCIVRDIWKSYDIVLGAQAQKRQLLIEPLGPARRAIREDKVGTVLGTWQFMVEVATQLGLHYPESRAASDLERDILQKLANRRVLFILDNLETMENIVEMLALLNRICSPPTRKALITARLVPQDHSLSLRALQLHSIKEVAACRQLVFERMAGSIEVSSENEFSEAVDAIVEVARGHPLALQLLTSKLVTQGRGPIGELRRKWESNSADSLNDEFLSALCNYAFDDRFREHIGGVGAELLGLIADEDFGVTEDELRDASGLEHDEFDSILTKVFGAGCIYRQSHADRTVLMMHPITQAHFRAPPVRGDR